MSRDAIRFMVIQAPDVAGYLTRHRAMCEARRELSTSSSRLIRHSAERATLARAVKNLRAWERTTTPVGSRCRRGKFY